MEKLTTIDQLKRGTRFMVFRDGECTHYEFLCYHPHNSNYIIAIESCSQEGRKLYIPNLLGETEAISHPQVYVGEYDSIFVCGLQYEYHKRKAEHWKKRQEEFIKDQKA